MADINENRPGYKKTKVGWIPEEWNGLFLGDLAEFNQGVQVPIKEQLEKPRDGFQRFIRIENYTQRSDDFRYVKVPKLKNKLVSSEDIAVVRYGASAGYIGRGLSGVLANNLFQITPKKSLLKDYLFFYLNQGRTYAFFQNMMFGGAMPALSFKIVKKLPLPLPPLPEQKKIAAILSTWDAAIRKLDRLIERKQTLKKGLMQQLLTGRRRFPEFVPPGGTRYQETKLGLVPEDWEVVRLGEIATSYSGLRSKSKKDFGSGSPYIPYLNIFSNSAIDIEHLDFVLINETENQNKVKFGDLFFTTSSETPDEVGMSSVLLNEVEDCYLNSFCFGFRLEDQNKTIPHYLRYALRGSLVRKAIFRLAQGATRYNLSKSNLVKVLIPFPPPNEQVKIATLLSTFDLEIGKLEQRKNEVEIQKKGLMQQLLTGAVRVMP